jgi:hypothetical protein
MTTGIDRADSASIADGSTKSENKEKLAFFRNCGDDCEIAVKAETLMSNPSETASDPQSWRPRSPPISRRGAARAARARGELTAPERRKENPR